MLISEELYDQIKQIMPISCIDLLITDINGRVLLIKRKNQPVQGKWWFPGGRVYFMETRLDAVTRKLKEECNLEPLKVKELGTYDVILDMPAGNAPSHGITTLFHVCVYNPESVRVDEHSEDAEWRFPEEWQVDDLHDFVHSNIVRLFTENGTDEYHKA